MQDAVLYLGVCRRASAECGHRDKLAAGTARARAARKKHACMHTVASWWLRRMMTKPCLVLSHDDRSWTPCAAIAISVKKMVKSPMFVAVLAQRSLGKPAARIAARDAEAITACATWPKPSAASPTPIAAAWCSELLACFPCLPYCTAACRHRKYRRSRIRQPGRKSADALSPKRTGPWKCYPRRYHVSDPSPFSVT